jgi:ABC-2 type transport system ATP-binding protein
MTRQPAGLALATHDLRKSYGSRVALDGLSLSVPPGIVYGFLGPNGAGKTTTMRLLTGLIHPDGGSIELLGRPFGRGDRHRLFEVGALVETPSFYPYLSARENLRALGATGAQTTRARIEELLELVGLRERASDKLSRYSLGMKQRLSHQLAEVEQMVDVIGIINRGRMVREGPIRSMLANEGVVRVRIPPDAIAEATVALADLAPPERIEASKVDPGWVTIHVEGEHAADVNRMLAWAGIYASRVEAGSDLEMLFLSLTGGEPSTHQEGTFMGIAGATVEPRAPTDGAST